MQTKTTRKDRQERRSRASAQSLGHIKSRNLYRQLLGYSVGALAIFTLAFMLVPTLISEASATNLVGVGANWAAISLTLDPDYEATQGGESPSLSTHGNVDFGEITPTAKASGVTNSSAGNVGTLEILKKTIRIDTTGNYYQVFLSMNNDDSNALKNTTNSYITVPAISSDGTNTGTWSSPAYFSAQGWGYAVTGDTEAITLPTFFTASPASIASSLGNELTYANDEAVYSGVKFSAVPLLSSPQQIYKNTTNVVGGFADNNADTFNVYYGVMVNTDVLAGTYNNQIVYTALASAANLDEVSQNIAYSKSIIAEDEEQTLYFDLASNTIPSTISTTTLKVYLVPHDEMLVAGEDGYDITELAGSYTECEVTNIDIDSTRTTVTCTSPASPNGIVDNSGTDTNGKFDYWVHIEGLDFNFVSKTADGSEAVAYIGLQSTYEKDDGKGEIIIEPYIAEMQEMSGVICRNTLAYNSSDASATTFSLDDVRDNLSYNIRKLGNDCWMVDNLRFVGNGIGTTTILSPETTDIISSTDMSFIEAIGNSLSFTEGRAHIGYDNNGDPAAWYNFAAASAMTVIGDTTDQSSAIDAESSICPKGWTLPTLAQANDIILMSNEFNKVLGGWISGQAIIFDGEDRGMWWTSNYWRNPGHRNFLEANGARVNLNTSEGMATYGFYIRCVARD